MVLVQLIIGKECSKCHWVTERMPEDPRIEVLDAKSPDAYALLAYHELISEKFPLPILFIDDVLQNHCYKHTKAVKYAVATKILDEICEALEEPMEAKVIE